MYPGGIGLFQELKIPWNYGKFLSIRDFHPKTGTQKTQKTNPRKFRTAMFNFWPKSSNFLLIKYKSALTAFFGVFSKRNLFLGVTLLTRSSGILWLFQCAY